MRVAIVGGGLAGFTVAQELRKLGSDATITLVDPQGLPYDRPPLSKDYLRGRATAEQLAFVEQSWFDQNSVELVTGRVTEVDPTNLGVVLEDGSRIEADEVVLAIGGLPRRLPVPGGDLDGICHLQTRAEADALRAELVEGRRVGIIGAGLIGSEVASTAVEAGCEVTLVSSSPLPCIPLWGRPLAERLHQMHADAGITVLTGVPHAVERTVDDFRVELSGDQVLEVETLLVAIGSENEAPLAEAAGVAVDGGITVDERQQTSVPHLYAVGDIARVVRADGSLAPGHGHWESAMQSGQRLAAVLAGAPVPEPVAPWMWSDRHGVHAEAVGNLAGGQLVSRVLDGVVQASFNLDITGRMVGAACIDGGQTVRAARRIIDRGIVVDAEQLADPSLPLKKLAK
ncbi:FAD-dependent oxidoreductase [Luteococcus sediminum]